MSTAVMGLLAPGQEGVPFMSILAVRISGKSLPSLLLCVRTERADCGGGAVELDRASGLMGVPLLGGFESEAVGCLDCCFVLEAC